MIGRGVRGEERERTLLDTEIELKRAVGFVAGHEGDILKLALVVCNLCILSLFSSCEALLNQGR